MRLCSKFNNIYKSVTTTERHSIPFKISVTLYYLRQGRTEPEIKLAVNVCQINDGLKPPA